MDDLSERFGNKLREIRLKKGFSQDKLAIKSGIDRSFIGRMDRGKVNITLKKLYTLAEALECEPSDLLP